MKPEGLLQNLSILIEGYSFEISAVVLRVPKPAPCPFLLGRPWLRTARIKQNWQRSTMTFRRGGKKIKIRTTQSKAPASPLVPVCAEGVHMLEGLTEEEADRYFSEHDHIIPLYEVNIAEIAEPYQSECSQEQAEQELGRAREALEKELAVSQRVKPTELEEVNIGDTTQPRPIFMAKDLQATFKTKLTETLHEYRDVFAWSYEDMKGLDPQFYQHKINLSPHTIPVKQRRYRLNPNYAARVKEEIDKLLRVGFIRPVKRATWLSPIVVVPKKNGKLRVCVDYRKLNEATINDAFPLPFTDGVLDTVAGHEMYTFLDGFSGYNQIRMAEEDQEKTAFVTEWGVFVAVVMMFGLKTAPATFQRIIMEIFAEYIPGFMQVFLDDFAVFGGVKEHLQHIRLCLQKCREARLSLNPAKCAFAVTSGMLLGHIVSKEGIAMDPDKVSAILEAPAPTNAKSLSRFLGQIRWHSRMIRYLADLATPLHAVVHKEPFAWGEAEDKAFRGLKILLSQAPVVQPPAWDKAFHVFVDASEVAIGSVLMQLHEENWYRPVYYASRRLSKAEKNYSTTEREALGMIYSVNKFRHYLLGKKFTFHVDHSALLYLISKASLTGKLARWTVLLQEYEFDIVHRPGAQHAVADYLSRLESGEEPTGVKDDFPDGGVLRITAEPGEEEDPDKWIVDMEFFLSNGIPPEEMGREERKRLGVQARSYCLFHGNLYHKSADGILRRVVRTDEQEDKNWNCPETRVQDAEGLALNRNGSTLTRVRLK